MTEIDREIIDQARGGDRMAQAEMFKFYKDYVFRSVFYMLKSRDEADDVTENVFVKIFGNLEKFDMGRAFNPWLSRITLNETRTYIKKYRKAYTNQDYSIDQMRAKQGASREIIQDVNNCLLDLTLKEREIITLRYFQELTIGEISSVMNLSVSNTKVRIHRATKKLKQIIQSKGESNVSR
ncbi:MAG: sigma-70 family RNA polymerase sigma factor [Caldisericia bacterium]|nr:sigma-70 family RNA polymerase sigma factor [Caldisericia bacterium]